MSNFSLAAYERVKAKRAQARAAYIAEHGEAPKRGPKPTKQSETLDLHIKLSGNLRAIVERKCRTQDYQMYITHLIEQDEFSDVCENS